MGLWPEFGLRMRFTRGSIELIKSLRLMHVVFQGGAVIRVLLDARTYVAAIWGRQRAVYLENQSLGVCVLFERDRVSERVAQQVSLV
jgi:hypothetical protein